MTSSLSVQLTTLKTSTRSPSPDTTQASLNKSDFTASVGFDGTRKDASALVEEALSNKKGKLIRVTQSTSRIPREMWEDMNNAKEMFWEGHPVTPKEVESMTDTDPEYQWKRQMLAGENFRDGLKGIGKGLLVVVSGVLVGRSAWRRYRPVRRDNTGKSGFGGRLSECLSRSIPHVGLQLGMKNREQNRSNFRASLERYEGSSCGFVLCERSSQW
jgi:hypothetical protein